jgi:hypothetical protein
MSDETATTAGMWEVEFAAQSIGQANDLLRQAVPVGVAPLTASQAGRLGYTATGSFQAVDEVCDFLLMRHEPFHRTKLGSGA